jgi:hypothetical protein
VDELDRRFDQDQMREAGGDLLGRKPSQRLLVDWTELGLVAAPTVGPRHEGGRGSSATWSWSDRELWLLVLRLHEHQRRGAGVDIAALANIPVGMWLYSDQPIRLVQVRRAMKSWRSRRSSHRHGHLAVSATKLVDAIKHRESRPQDRRRLRRQLYGLDLRRESARPGVFRTIDAVMLPERPRPGATTDLAATLAGHVGRTLVERFIGLAALPDDPLDERADDLLMTARERTKAMTARHRDDPVARSVDTLLGSRHEPVGEEERIWVGCRDLATALGQVIAEQNL